MWLMTPRGFYSVVQHRDDPLTVLIRARSREDLERLCDLSSAKVFPPETGGWLDKSKILSTPRADYPYRLYAPRRAWANALAELGDEIDYGNFKDAVKAEQGTRRASTYMGVWSQLRKIEHEDREPEEFQEPLWSEADWAWLDGQYQAPGPEPCGTPCDPDGAPCEREVGHPGDCDPEVG